MPRRRASWPLENDHLHSGAALRRHCCAHGPRQPMNGEASLAYVEQALVPELPPHDIVIMDNLRAHKVHGVRQAIEAAGATLRDLPPYSPDVNPIEMAFAKLKAALAPPPRERFPTSGKPSLTPFVASPHKNAPTISPPQETMQPEWKMLCAGLSMPWHAGMNNV